MVEITRKRCNYFRKLATYKILIIILILILLVNVLNWEECAFLDKTKSSRFCNETTSIVFSNCDGRLGNQVSSLATLLAFHMKYGLRPYLLREQKILLEKVFEKVNLPVLELEILENSALKIRIIARDKDSSGDYYYDDFMENPESLLKGHAIDVGPYPNALFFYKRYLPYIKKELVIKKRYLLQASELLSDISRMYEGKSPVFIGVHVRRMDYEYHLKSTYGAKSSYVNKIFFEQAMDEFRMRLDNQGEVIFVVVSDDVEWIVNNLGSRKNVYIGSKITEDEFESKITVEWFDSKITEEFDSMARDFALLSLCNHTIQTYGTFGQWGALLAGGHTILPRGYSEILTRELVVIDRAKLPNWSFIQV